MSTNRHAYMDYHGPRLPGMKQRPRQEHIDNGGGEVEEEEENPLGALAWSEGESLAPPCGSSVPLIHAMLDFGSVNQDDVLYDLGCGDARVLLEAAVKNNCRQCVGIEVEHDLVERSNKLIESLPLTYRELESPQDGIMTPSTSRIQIVHGDLRRVLKEFVWRIEKNDDSIIGGQNTSSERPYRNLPIPTVLTMSLLPEGIAEIEEDLMKLLPHIRIISCSWGLKAIRPIEEKEFYDQRTRVGTTLYLYTKECFERLKGFEYMLDVYNHGH